MMASKSPVSDARLIRYVRTHPDCRPRDVAAHFYTPAAAMAVGARLSKLTKAGHLTARFDDGWRYTTATPRPDAGFLHVQAQQCTTCIYRADSALDIANLESAIADPRMPGHFVKFRACHHAPDAAAVVCRGFWNRHKDDFDGGQLAQRLNAVRFVHVDRRHDVHFTNRKGKRR